jgi:hypothetical protein
MLHKLIRMSIALGVIALIAVAFSFLALLDIAHGEADLRLEWAIIRGSAALLIIFIAQAIVTLVRANRAIPAGK